MSLTDNVSDVTLTPACASAVRHVRYHSIASLTFLVWNFIVKFDDEVQHIWRMNNRNPFKWVYFFLRYSVIFTHITHNSLMEPLSNGSNPPALCRSWWTYNIAFSQFLETILEIILSARVYALYNRSRSIALLLSTLILAELVGTVRILVLQNEMEFYHTCLLMHPPNSASVQSIFSFCVHCTLITLTLFKYFFAFRAGWGRTPLVSLVIRDGTMVYATTFFALVTLLITLGLQNNREVAVTFWISALISTLGCHLILRMESFARREMSAAMSRAMFTSEFDFTDSGNDGDRSTI